MSDLDTFQHRGHSFSHYRPQYEVTHPYCVSGELWYTEAEPTRAAVAAIMATSPVSIEDDSETSCIFLNVKTEGDARKLIDHLIDVGRLPNLDAENRRTTLVVSVHYKVDVDVLTPEDTKRQALDVVMNAAEHGARLVYGLSVEGASVLVNEDAYQAMFA